MMVETKEQVKQAYPDLTDREAEAIAKGQAESEPDRMVLVLNTKTKSLDRIMHMGEIFGGWVLDPTVNNGRPAKLEKSIVYHLVKPELVQPTAPESRIVSAKKAKYDEVDRYIGEGYTVKDFYANHAILVKTEVPEE